MRIAVLLLVLVRSAAVAQTLHYEGSAGLATGTYIFTERTSSWNLSTGLALGVGPVTLRASMPVFYQSTTLVTSTGLGYVPTGGSSGGAVSDSSVRRSGQGASRRALATGALLFSGTGVAGEPVRVPASAVTGFRWAYGDPLVSASVSGLRLGRLRLLIGLSVKVPVVDTADFGTGAWDVGGTLSGAALVSSRVMVSLDMAYWRLGDPPGLDLVNPFTAGGTVSFLAARGWGFAAGVTGSTPTIPGFAPSISATASVVQPGRRGALGLLATVGLTETAPDVSIVVTWRVGLLH